MVEENKDGNAVVPGSQQDAGPATQIESPSNQQADQEMTVSQSEQTLPIQPAAQQQQTKDQQQVSEEIPESQPNPDGFFADTSDASAVSVRVAVRIRPLIGKELRSGDKICVDARESENQIIMGKDRAFTFDKTFGIGSQQEVVFNTCVRNLVLGCFVGFNATILAYGQTGSGKTFTMGSGYTIGVKEEDLGIIPRVIRMIFDEKEARKAKAEIIIKCQFLEIYNEELHDLLERKSGMVDQMMPAKKEIGIREEKNGTISVYGLKEMTVNSAEEMAGCLDMGSSQRVTACTLMNSSSSRSHGIFTIAIEQHMIEDELETGAGGADAANAGAAKQEKPDEHMTAKFHFVDLAGSERAKATGATGEQFREGVNINKSLLALGNVISSLTDPSKKGHVPYRDSKLTRILQDSLGGNSRTVMIAACSPAECNFLETLNSLKYASRARNIKNKPVVNRDPASMLIAQLRQTVFEHQKELHRHRKVLMGNNIAFETVIELPEAEALEKMGAAIQSTNKSMGIVPTQGGGGGGADPAEVKRLEQQVQELKAQLAGKEKEFKSQKSAYDTLQDQHQQAQIAQFELQKDRDFQKYSLEEMCKVLKQRNLFEDIVKEINGGVLPDQSGEGINIFDTVFGNAGPTVLEEYQRKVEESSKELQEAQLQLSQLQSDNQQLIEQARRDTQNLVSKEVELERQRRLVDNLTRDANQLKDELRKAKSETPSTQAKSSTGAGGSFSSRRATNPALRRGSTQRNSIVQQQPLDTAKWLDDDFAGVKIKGFDEMREGFIEDLTNQFSDLLVPQARHQSVKINPSDVSILQVAEATDVDQEMAEGDSDEEKKSNKGSDHGARSEASDAADSDEEDSNMIPDEKPDGVAGETMGDQTALENDLIAQINELEAEEQELDDNVKHKEALLDKIKEQQKEMQDVLLKEMREEYHKKISLMVGEIQRLASEKTETLQKSQGGAQKSRVEEAYKKKEAELKIKLKELEKKQREQTQLTKALNQQKLKTNSMEQEIGKMKTQKVTMMKKIKEETDNRTRLQKQGAKEKADLKRKLARQQKELDTVKREKTKADIQAKRKHEEVVAMQKRAKIDEQKKKNATKIRQQAKRVDTGKIKEWIIENTEKMVDYQFMQIEKVKEQNQCAEIEQKIDEEQRQYAKLTVECDKLLQRQGRLQLADEGTCDDDIYQTEQDIQEIQNQVQSIREHIKSLEEEQGFVHSKITQQSKQLIEVRPMGVDSMVFADVQTLEGARACIGTFFQLLLDSNLQLREQQGEIDHFQNNMESLVNDIEEINIQRKQEERQKELELQQLHQEYDDKERMLVELILQKTNLDIDFDQHNQEEGENQINLLQLIDLLLTQVKAHNLTVHDKIMMSAHEEEMLQNSKNENLKRGMTAKLENREAKKESYNANKAALAKRNVELEKKTLDQDAAMKRLKLQLDSANQDKAKFKRLHDQEKRNKGAEDQSASLQGQTSIGASSGLSLKEARAQRKMLKTNQSIGSAIALPGRISNLGMQSASGTPINVPAELQLQTINTGDSEMSDRQQNPDGGQMVGESDVFNRLAQRKGRSRVLTGASPRDAMQKQLSREYGPTWNMVHDNHDAHKSPVYAMTSVGNQLYSAAARSLRIWDVGTMKLLSDLTEKIGVIKAIAFWKERNLLMTAAEKSIMMWDVVSLTNVGVLKGFTEEIKALHFVSRTENESDLLFAASKGSGQTGGLLVYDLRKTNSSPMEEFGQQQDVFSLTSSGSHIFYGCRNHHVYPFCLKTFTTLQHLQPPHFDVVTSLAMMNNGATLVSGSRDKNLRLYDLTQPNLPELSNILTAHNDHINVLETDDSQQYLYSGSRDGIVRVWQQGPGKELNLAANLEGNAQHSQVKTICKLTSSDIAGGQAFACGSADKSIRIYRMSEQQNAISAAQIHEVHHQQQLSNNNVEMVDESQQQKQQPSSSSQHFTATQMSQLQELEMIQSQSRQIRDDNYGGLSARSAQAAAEQQHQEQQQQQQQQQEESGALNLLSRRKKQKQRTQQNH